MGATEALIIEQKVDGKRIEIANMEPDELADRARGYLARAEVGLTMMRERNLGLAVAYMLFAVYGQRRSDSEQRGAGSDFAEDPVPGDLPGQL